MKVFAKKIVHKGDCWPPATQLYLESSLQAFLSPPQLGAISQHLPLFSVISTATMTQPGDAQAFLSSLEPLECAICLEEYDTSHPPIMLGRRHIFGENCLKDWVEAGTSTCPNCRAPLFGEESAAPPSEQVQPPPVEVPTDVVREELIVPTSQEIPQLPMEVLADFIREDNMVRWSQEPQQRRVQVSTDVMHVIARQSAWDVLVNQRMRRLVSRSERLVASLLRLPG